ncbi:FMN-binding negative transcriptional regulator [Microbacterium resistens]|uniref:FMN-binding negative transcriptional regulator n=1 Tax=Microbacterium resistens TaxID=156977 RepID=UPI001C587014|nr:FMN-binding negative transcriptional regulator [Microbacterium resistens]MBW1637558.1 FMN-binding negative transcriptional regulator [Microbacterium resistens]
MRPNPDYALEDPHEIARLIERHPFATLVSAPSSGTPVASHYPILLDREAEDLTVISHVGRPDERIHELGRHPVLLIVHGPQGYISPGWYDDRPAVPTWNFVVAHLWGTPEILDERENLRMLGELVDRFEGPRDRPRRMLGAPEDAAYARRIHTGTVGYRLRVTRVEAKRKLSQDKPADVVHTVIDRLETDPLYANPALAAAMKEIHS